MGYGYKYDNNNNSLPQGIYKHTTVAFLARSSSVWTDDRVGVVLDGWTTRTHTTADGLCGASATHQWFLFFIFLNFYIFLHFLNPTSLTRVPFFSSSFSFLFIFFSWMYSVYSGWGSLHFQWCLFHHRPPPPRYTTRATRFLFPNLRRFIVAYYWTTGI